MIEGSLRDAPFADVVQVLASGQKSGVLTIERGPARARIYLEMGRIQAAHLSPGVHLGEVLVRMDLLTAREVQELLLRQTTENAGTPLGLAAAAAGLLEEADLRAALERQALEVVHELLGWRSGDFAFAERPADASQVPTEHALEAMPLLLRASGHQREAEGGTVAPGAVLRRSGDPTRVDVPPDAWELLPFLDGRRSAASVAAESDLPEVVVYRRLWELERLGVAERVEFAPEEPVALVLTPSPALQRLLRLALQRGRVRAVVAADAAEALGALAAARPRLLVVDEEGGGWDFVRELRRQPGQAHLPALVLVAEEPRGLGRLRRPKASVLRKPFHEIDLQQAVGQMLGRASP